MRLIDKTVDSICHTLVIYCQPNIKKNPNQEKAFLFVFNQINTMPDFFKAPFKMLIIFFDISSLLIYQTHFYNLNLASRLEILFLWKKSKFSFMRDFFYFFESFVIYELAS